MPSNVCDRFTFAAESLEDHRVIHLYFENSAGSVYDSCESVNQAFHGEADNVVPFSDALEIYQKARNPKKLIRQPGGNHLMSNQVHQKEFIREAALWFKTYFELSSS